MPDADLVKQLEDRLPDDFSKDLFRGALDALGQANVVTRAQHFSVSMRELSEHLLLQLAPDDAQIKTCIWYTQHPSLEGPTRRQRALYFSRGGLADTFLRNELKLDPQEFHVEIGPAFNRLNRSTHLKPGTVIADPAELEDFANDAIGALVEIFEVTESVRREIVERVQKRLYDEAVNKFISETISSLDLVAGHYETGSVLYDEVRVVELDGKKIRYEITGTVDVSLHYGSGSDTATIRDQFPFTCRTEAIISEPLGLQSDSTEMEVDTASWYETAQTEADRATEI